MTAIPASTRHKIEQQKRAAPFELPKARLCGAVVEAFLSGGSAVDTAVDSLKKQMGGPWGLVLAFQYMSGRQAQFAAECAEGQERARLLVAHRVAKAVSETCDITRLNLAELRAICVTAAAEASKAVS